MTFLVYTLVELWWNGSEDLIELREFDTHKALILVTLQNGVDSWQNDSDPHAPVTLKSV